MVAIIIAPPEMAITSASSSDSPDIRAPLLYDTVEGSVDYKGRSVYKFNSGGWRSASFIIGKFFLSFRLEDLLMSLIHFQELRLLRDLLTMG